MKVFDTPGSVSLQIKLPSGRVVVAATEEARTSVELTSLGRRGSDALEDVVVTADEIGGRHVIRIEQRDRIRWGPIQISWGEEVEVRIACPPGTDLELSGAKTELRATGELGAVTARTVSGDVRLEDVRGKLEVKTASGDVFVAGVDDAASVVTVSGDIDVGRVEVSFTGRAVSGDIGIGSIAGPLTLATTSGDVAIRSVRAGEVRVQTVSGDVRVGVGRGTRVWIDAASLSGDLSSDLGVEDAAPPGPSDEPVVPIQLKTVSGDVSIVRAAEPVSA
jgi:DUF4097 and DUF4098 domain-containing protein YvlB